VTEAEGSPAAVLIRALEPIDGVDLMVARRSRGQAGVDERDLCRGPGNLTQALGITLEQNRADLVASTLRIEDRRFAAGSISWGPRIGIRHGVDRRWRCWVNGHPCVSGHRATMKVRHANR
jgi:DNA-3-methyladenine glycosylase